MQKRIFFRSACFTSVFLIFFGSANAESALRKAMAPYQHPQVTQQSATSLQDSSENSHRAQKSKPSSSMQGQSHHVNSGSGVVAAGGYADSSGENANEEGSASSENSSSPTDAEAAPDAESGSGE